MSWHRNRQRGIPHKERQYIFRRDQGICRICHTPIEGPYDVDHIRPVAEGGTDDRGNLSVVHPTPCHAAKTAAEIRRGRQRNTRLRPPEPHPATHTHTPPHNKANPKGWG